MVEIHPNLLWIGNSHYARDVRTLSAIQIEAVVDLAYEEPPAQLPRQLIYCRFPINDGGGNDASMLRSAVSCTVRLLCEGTKTLVACGAGRSRSPIVASFALAQQLGDTPDKVVARLADRTSLEVNPILWNDVKQAASQICT